MRDIIIVTAIICLVTILGFLLYKIYDLYLKKYITSKITLPPATNLKYPYIPPSLNNTNDYDEIPKVVYQTWNTHSLPPLMKETHEKFKEDNPEFQYILFDDDECRKFIETHFEGEVLNAYDSLIPGAFKADLWRYCVLYVNGGVYLDIKYMLFHRPEEEGNEDTDTEHAKTPYFRLVDLFDKEKYPIPMVVETSPLYVYTGLLMTPAKNPLYMECIGRIVENVKHEFYGNSPMAPTGPELFGGLIEEADKNRAVLFYYDDYFLKEEEKEKRVKYYKQGFIKDTRNENDILCHYLDYRIEQMEYSKTGYWMNLWKTHEIYKVPTNSFVWPNGLSKYIFHPYNKLGIDTKNEM